MAHERVLYARGVRPVAGVDEAGRGPLAGPVVAAAAVLPEDFSHPVLDDSKRLRPAVRAQLFAELAAMGGLTWAVAVVEPAEIDRLNILRATHEAMRRAVRSLATAPAHALIDGLPVPDFPVPQTALVGGDHRSFSIAAASVFAKVTRDRLLDELDRRYPGYGFGRHKGYPTPLHLERLRRLGPCPAHRRSFAPVGQGELFTPQPDP